MTNSKEYRHLKKLYHEQKLKVKNVEIQHSKREEPEHWGKVVFEDDEKEEIELEGTSEDFVFELWSLKSTVREGEERIVDISATPAKNPEGYYDNIEHFVSKDKSAVEKGFEELQQEAGKQPEEIDLLEALDASIALEMDNEELVTVVTSYHQVVASHLIEMKRVQEEFDNYKESIPYDSDRFENYLNEAGAILRDAYVNTTPIIGYQSYRETMISDTPFLLERMSEIREKTHREWRALSQKEGGSIEGRIAMPRILEDYARYYELARDPLRDLAATIDDANAVELDDTSDVVRFLKRQGHQNLMETIIPELRHGSSHMSIEVDDDNGLINIYDRRGRGRSIEEQINFKQLLSKYKKFRDLVDGLIFAFVLNEEVIIWRYLNSNEFRFRVVENTDPEILSRATQE